MKRILRRWLALAACALMVGLAGCAQEGPAPTTGDIKSLEGTGNYDNMPPEARKAMEEAKAKAATGPSRGN